MKNNIFIIGSNSFSGSNFINYLLDKNFFIVGISRSKENKNIFLKYKKNKNKKNFIFYNFLFFSRSVIFLLFIKFSVHKFRKNIPI